LETEKHNKNRTFVNGYMYVFGEFELEPSKRTCVRSGVQVPLTGKVFDLLLAFVENPARLLGKDELMELVWRDEFVEEGNLTRNVSTLRKALGDTGKEHKYIATIPGHGYRFIADVAIHDDNNEADLAAARAIDKEPPRVTSVASQLLQRPLLLLITVLCLVSGSLVAFRLDAAKPKLIEMFSLDRLKATRLAPVGNYNSGSVISPDGQYLLYSRNSGDERGLWVRQLSTGSSIELRGLETGASLWAAAFAPDNSFVYCVIRESNANDGNVYSIPLLGGQQNKITSHANGGLTVSPDGKKLAFQRIDREAGTSSIVVVDQNGENEHAIASAELDSLFCSLDWAPDGVNIVYSFKQHDTEGDHWYLAEISATGGAERRIGEPSDLAILAEKWLPDKSGLIVNAIDETTRQPQLYAVSYPDGAKRRITINQNSLPGFSMTADGRIIIVPQIISNREIWNISGNDSENAEQLLSGTERHFDSVSWTDDGYIFFDEDENSSFDHFNIYRMRYDGSELQQMTFGPGNNRMPVVSPDGQTVVFVSSRSGKSQLWRMNIDGHEAVQITDIPEDVLRPVFSPDGQAVFFSVSVAGKRNIWRVPIRGGNVETITEADVYHWDVSPDGIRLAFSTFDKRSRTERTTIRSLIGNEPDRVLDIAPETWVEWSKDGKAIYYDTLDDEVKNIWIQKLDGSKPHPVTAFDSQRIFRFGWSRDGNTLACVRQNISFDAVKLSFQ
jgi:Tol biopolymer transport system component/DNA-binding winged helix-turn-helix (wHTH) protein